MPREKIAGVPVTIYDDAGKATMSGVTILDIGWGKGMEGVSLELSLHLDDTPDQPGTDVQLPQGVGCTIGSWSQINRMLAVLKRARNDAYGTPE